MKKILLFSALLIVACGSDDTGNSSNNSDGVDYFLRLNLVA